MLDLFPVIKGKVLQMIENKEHKLNIYEFIDGQKSVYSIDMEQAKILKEIVDKEMEEN